MLSDRETKSLTVLDSMSGRDIYCLWNCYSLFAQREFIEALQEFSENFQHSNESDWSVPGGYNCMLPGFTVVLRKNSQINVFVRKNNKLALTNYFLCKAVFFRKLNSFHSNQ